MSHSNEQLDKDPMKKRKKKSESSSKMPLVRICLLPWLTDEGLFFREEWDAVLLARRDRSALLQSAILLKNPDQQIACWMTERHGQGILCV